MSPTIIGGLRSRLIRDSFGDLVRNGLAALGWFDAGRNHLPLQFITQPAHWDDPIDLNSIVIVSTDITADEIEMGSVISEETWDFYVDFYAESEAMGQHVIGDVRDILRGRIPSIGRDRPILEVMNKTLATPVPIFVCQIENVLIDRANSFNRPHERFFYTCRAEVLDYYGTEDDA